jgi:hypothetical protein
MAVEASEVMRGCVILFEGKPVKVKAISEYIMIEGRKEFIGGGFMNGEPLSEKWLLDLGFSFLDDRYYLADPKSSRIIFIMAYKYKWLADYTVNDHRDIPLRLISYVHELQVLTFAIIGQHLKVPKLK